MYGSHAPHYTHPYNSVNTHAFNSRVHSGDMSLHTTIAALIDQKLKSSAYPSFNALAKAAGVNQPTLLRIYSGDSHDPSRTSLEKIARFFGCSVEDLYSGAALSLSVDSQSENTVSASKNVNCVVDRHRRDRMPSDTVEIPQYDAAGAMGNGGLMLRDQPGVIANWHVSPDWLHKNVRASSGAKNLCIVTGFGDSMRPTYNPGDPLLVDTGVRTVEADAVYFFRVGSEGFIKRIQRIPGVGYVVKSSNPEYDSWTVTPDMDFHVLGRVLKVWRSEEF